MRRSHSAAPRTSGGGRRSPRHAVALLLVTLLGLAGVGFLVGALTMEPPRPPQPAEDAAPPGFDPAGDGPGSAPPDRGAAAEEPDPEAAAEEPVSLAESVPTRITIPEIDVDAKIMKLGVDDDNQVEVPPLDEARQAGWYKYGVTPGEIGNSVIIGHVDSYKIGPAVFFRLGKLKPGDTIKVTRKDQQVAEFRVDGVKAFPKAGFPHELVYGPADAAQLRVVTCGGEFDEKEREYRDNIVVFATLAQ